MTFPDHIKELLAGLDADHCGPAFKEVIEESKRKRQAFQSLAERLRAKYGERGIRKNKEAQQ